jgi:hypothetical protein
MPCRLLSRQRLALRRQSDVLISIGLSSEGRYVRFWDGTYFPLFGRHLFPGRKGERESISPEEERERHSWAGTYLGGNCDSLDLQPPRPLPDSTLYWGGYDHSA